MKKFLKKLLIYWLCSVFITSSAFADLIPQPVVFRGVMTGLQVSYGEDNAFIDNADVACDCTSQKILASGSVSWDEIRFGAATDNAFIDTTDATFSAALTGNLDKYIVIKDSDGHEIEGWIKAAGTGETLGAEVITVENDRTFTVDTGFWTLPAGWTIAGGKAVATAAAATEMIDDTGHLTVGALYKVIGTYTDTSGGCFLSFGAGSYRFPEAGTGVVTYGTARGTKSGYYGYNFTGTVDDISWMPVTAPSALGVTIVSDRSGTVYNWSSAAEWFYYNEFYASYTYTIYDRKLLTDFVDGSHLIEIYDDECRGLRGVLKALGTGVTFGDDSLAGWDFTTPGEWNCNAGTITNATTVTANSSTIAISKANAFAALGALHKITWDRTVTAGSPILISGSTTVHYSSSTATDKYVTCGGDRYWYIYVNDTSSGNTLVINTQACRQVLTPSAKGATIVTQKDGTDYNFISRTSGWSQNDASYYVIIKEIR